MFIIASEQTRELDRLQKYLDKLSPSPAVFCDQSGNRFGPTTEKIYDLLKDPASKVGKPLFFNDLAVSQEYKNVGH